MVGNTLVNADGWRKPANAIQRRLGGISPSDSINCRWPSMCSVSNAMVDFPEPDRPVKTTSLFLGIDKLTFFKLCSRAPRILMFWFMIDRSISGFISISRRRFAWQNKPDVMNGIHHNLVKGSAPDLGAEPFRSATRNVFRSLI